MRSFSQLKKKGGEVSKREQSHGQQGRGQSQGTGTYIAAQRGQTPALEDRVAVLPPPQKKKVKNRTKDVAQLVEHLPSRQEALGLIPVSPEAAMMAQVCNRVFEWWMQKFQEFKTNLSYMSMFQKKS